LEYQHKEYVSRWLEGKISGNRDGGEISTHIRDYLIEKAGYKCSKCRWSQTNPVTKTVPLQINHIDGDSKNSRPSNLEVVCPNCHSLTPTYGSLNLGKWREKRRKRYGELTVPANGTGLNPFGS
jgi:5-methylcytosine-specific restriction endonuclease McrA